MPAVVRPLKEAGTLISPQESNQLASGYVTLAPRRDVGEHRTGNGAELIVFMVGTAEVSVDGRTLRVPSPSIVLVSPHTLHNVKNGGDVPLRYVYVYVTASTPNNTKKI